MSSRRYRRFSAAFTLIELISVLAIGSVLVALLMSSLPQVWKRMDNTKCLGNLRALSGAYAAYNADYRFWPSFNREDVNNPTAYGTHPWFYSLIQNGYIPSRKITRDGYVCLVADALVCPANKENPGSRYQWTPSPFPWRSNYTTTGYWGTSQTDSNGAQIIPGNRDRVRPGTITNSQAIVLVDSTTSPNAGYPDQAADWAKPICFLARVHNGCANALLASGAVVQLSPANQPDIADPKYWDPRAAVQ